MGAVTEKAKKRYEEIDLCRGFGILLVVLGHALKQTGETNPVFETVNAVIYSFHMPMFFFLSGFVAVKVLDLKGFKEKEAYIRGRAFRLLIPYFFVGLCYMPLKYMLSRYAVKAYDFSQAWKLLIGENPNTALWFLYALFWISCICGLFLTRKNLPLFLTGSLALALAAWGMGIPSRLLQYGFFFVLGIEIRCEYGRWRKIFENTAVFWGSLAVFGLTNAGMLAWGMPGMTVVSALAGSLCCMYLSVRLSGREGRVKSGVALLGNWSMDIYILSEPFNTVVKLITWNILGLPYLLCTLACFEAALLLPVPVSRCIVRKVKLFRVLLLGVR